MQNGHGGLPIDESVQAQGYILNCLIDKLFLDLGDEFTPVAWVVQQESYWELHYAVVQLLYPLYRLLRLADMRIGGLDRVKCYILQADRLMNDALENVVTKWKASHVMAIASLSTVGYTIMRSQEISERLITVLFVTYFEARAALNL